MIQIKFIEKEDLKCWQDHKFPVCSINTGANVQMNERFLCSECMSTQGPDTRILGLNIIQSKIENNINEYIKKKISFISQKKQELQKLQNQISLWKSNVIQIIDQILGELNQWIESVVTKEQVNDYYSFIQELNNFINKTKSHEKDFKLTIQQISNINKASINKIELKLKKLNEEHRKTLLQTKDALLDIIQIPQPKITLTPINNQLKQSETCYSIAVNYTGQIMISGCDKDIKVWDFQDGQILELQKLSGHQNRITCLLFSKNSNSFISGSVDNTIRCWKLENGQEWNRSQSYNDHSNNIQCLLLSKNENTLFSGSMDKSIKIWMVDFQNNKLMFCYSLTKHSGDVYGLSLNESETFLASCGEDKQIIIWNKRNDNKWEFYQVVKHSVNEPGATLCFVNENQFIWIGGIKDGKDCVSYFQLNNDNFIELNENEQQLIVSSEFSHDLFPIVIDKEKEIILLRHKFHIYLLTKQVNGRLKILTNLKFESNSIYGTMTNDTKFLILWEKRLLQYLIYQIEYQII